MDEAKTSVLGAIQSLVDSMGVERAFGQPRQQGEVTVIPVAEVTVGLGYGAGRGPAERSEPDQEAGESSAPGGSGGGAGGRIVPRGYIRITPSGVTYEPTVDVQKLALAGMLLAGWIAFWLARTQRVLAQR